MHGRPWMPDLRTGRGRLGAGALCCALIVFAHATALGQTVAPPGGSAGPQSGLPLPRYGSLKSDRVNMRAGPTLDTPIQWVYRRAGLPVEVLREIEGWRQIRDGEGTTGWISSALLSNRRTVQIAPWEEKTPSGQRPIIEIRAESSPRSAATALVEAGVIASLTSCDGTWCRVTVGDARGYVEQKKLWGVYPNEIVK